MRYNGTGCKSSQRSYLINCMSVFKEFETNLFRFTNDRLVLFGLLFIFYLKMLLLVLGHLIYQILYVSYFTNGLRNKRALPDLFLFLSVGHQSVCQLFLIFFILLFSSPCIHMLLKGGDKLLL